MTTTPEGRVKNEIKKVLDKYKPELYYQMTVPSGYGVQGVDFVGCFKGRFFVIEAKAAGKKPTPRQEAMLEAVAAAGGKTFVIVGESGFVHLHRWLERIRAENEKCAGAL